MKAKKKSAAPMPPLPEGFLRNMEATLGAEESARLAGALDEAPSVSVRLNRRKVTDPAAVLDGFGCAVTPVEWCPSGYYLEQRPDFIHDPLLHAGAYYVQEAASMIYEELVEKAVRTDRPLKILDLCAAPGGKTTALLNGLAGHDYLLVANEYDGKRVRILKENLDKWGDPDVIVTNSPTSRFGAMGETFDVVAADAPCSGEGMMRREAVARSQWSETLVEQCGSLQREILSDAVACLKEGGILIFSTCTFNSTENEANVEWLLNQGNLSLLFPARRFMPHRDRCEGLFAAVFRKGKEGSAVEASDKDKMRRNLVAALKKQGIKIVSDGIERSVKKGNLEIPSSRRVLACDYSREEFPEVELNREEALAYLRKNTLSLPPDTPEGYICVTYKGLPLGLVKNLGTRANNLYPPEWRVLT